MRFAFRGDDKRNANGGKHHPQSPPRAATNAELHQRC